MSALQRLVISQSWQFRSSVLFLLLLHTLLSTTKATRFLHRVEMLAGTEAQPASEVASQKQQPLLDIALPLNKSSLHASSRLWGKQTQQHSPLSPPAGPAPATAVATKAATPLTLDDVAFGVLTCHKYLGTRLLAQRRTWLRGLRHVAAFTDTAPSADLASQLNLKVVVDGRQPGPKELMATDGAPRALPMVEALHTSFPHAKWYFLSDDDTFVYVPTLFQEVLSKRNYTDSHYIGWAYQPGSFQGFQPDEWIPPVAIGGAGFAISHGLMEKLAPEVPRCRNAYTWDWPGDLRIAQCIANLGFEVEDDPHFHPESPHLELQFGRNWQATKPVSFHHLSPDDMYHLSAGQHVPSKTHTLEANFADLALADISFRDISSKLTVTLLFGLEVNISASQSVAPLSAGDLLTFVSAEPGTGHDFEQEYQGRNISVHLDLVCGTCPAGTSSVRTMVPSRKLVACSLQSAGTRNFRILLAAPKCPGFLPVPMGGET